MAPRTSALPQNDVRHSPAVVNEDFGRIASTVFGRIRQAMGQLVDASPGPVRRAVDLQKALSVDAPLAWRVFKTASADDPFEVIDYTLTPGQVNTLVDAAKKKRIPAEITTEVRAAIDGYTDLLHEHAGNRDVLNMMVASLRPEKNGLIDEKCRKITFQQNSLIWGQQEDVLAGCFIVYPRRDSRVIDTAMIMGHIGFHEVRPGMGHELTLQAKIFIKPDEQNVTAANGELLREFCSPELSSQVTLQDEEFTKVQVRLPGLGRRAAVDYFQLFTAEQEVPLEGASDNHVHLNALINRPTAMLSQDILVPHTGMPRAVKAGVYGRVNDYNASNMRATDLMPIEISATYLGAHTEIPDAPGIPRYPEVVRSVLGRLGWQGTRFDVYRCRLAYPVLHTLIRLWIENDKS